MRALLEEKRLNVISLLQHGHSTREVSKLLGISQSTCFKIRRECVSHVESSRGGCPRNITHAQQQMCVRAITISGLDNVVDVRNALSKHFECGSEHQHNHQACTS
jgi:transposase